MADSDNADLPDAPPPEVPEEFAATYRDAYRRALEGEDDEPLPVEPGAHRVTEYRAGTPLEHLRQSAWFVPLVAVVGVLALVLVGWLIARGLGGDDPAPARQSGTADATRSDPTAASTGGTSSRTGRSAHRGPVEPVAVTSIAATCTLAPGVDAAGRTVDYVAGNATDGDLTTAWRCEGDATGERIVLRLPKGTEVAAVGLVPGYAKTDAASGADRYAENNRITRVRWIFADGVSIEQRFDPAPGRRELQVLRIPPTATDRVVLEILAVQKGSRGATAISEIRLSVPRA